MYHFFMACIALVLAFHSSIYAEEGAPSQKICLNMIVKNESQIITRCLASTLPLIDSWVIVDTGSTDGTQQIIKDFMEKHSIPGILHERPWVNFGHNRNEALALAREAGDYILFMDADEYLIFDDPFKRSLLDKDYYYVRRTFSGTTYSRIMLIDSRKNLEWVGAIHEVLVPGPNHTFATLEHVTNVCTTEGARSKDPLKYHKDAQLLEEELAKAPDHTRNRFYLAQSYRDAGDNLKALEHYEKRVALGGWDQEVYYSLLQIAVLKERLNMPLDTLIESYHRAYQYRSSRIEALYHLARLLRSKKDYEAAYKITQIAYSMPPSRDVLLVESWISDYGIALERSVSAYWLGKYEECQRISRQLLKRTDLPDSFRETIERNLAFANGKLVEKIVPLSTCAFNSQ